ncbi:hypothetical protein [Streptomyces sp. NBC_00847]|uniref:hypothetical protein n=1 Tax=Streptomyces sp. NBC_00847 TaxID=2975850 RepID=UPI00224F390D|nr:hypothetical protein [Streptomyces sp. NBC_00847]MCX4882556.1 hypothetical protein [Streptomyces sp. NBC_00847]
MENGQVRTLRFAVEWVDQHPVTWLEGAFPASYEVEGWKLTLTETKLAAAPAAPMTEDKARSAVMPLLDTWSAELEVDQRLVVMLYYLGADVEPGATDTKGTVASADFATASAEAFDATVVIQRDAPPQPDWSWRDTEVTKAARTMCLRPLRNGTRPIADAAYWLSTHLKKWATDGDQTAPERLNVSSSYFNKVSQSGARSDERKVSAASQTLSAQDKESLRRAVEELIRRLHLAESGLHPGRHLDLSDWP